MPETFHDVRLPVQSDLQGIAARGFGLRSAEDLSASGRHRSIPSAAREEQPLEPRVIRALPQI